MLVLNNGYSEVKINGCLSIKTFQPGERISITQLEDVVLKDSKEGKHPGEWILEVSRNGITHEVIVEPFSKGKNLYKVLKFSPAPII